MITFVAKIYFIMNKTILLLLLALFATNAFSQSDYTTEYDIPYSAKSDDYSRSRLKLDIHHPTGEANLPVVVWFHGGGLTSGEKHIPEELKEQGYVVIAPNYRLIPKVGVTECIDDAAEAVAWAFDNASRYGGDPERIIVSGHSAGGFLTSMVGLDRSRLAPYGKDPDSIAALIPFSGQVITHFSDRKSKGIKELTPYVDSNSPLFHVRKDAPPYIIITGDADLELFGRYEENLYMWRMMKLNGHPEVRIYKLDGFNHGDMCHPAFKILKDEAKRLTGNGS